MHMPCKSCPCSTHHLVIPAALIAWLHSSLLTGTATTSGLTPATGAVRLAYSESEKAVGMMKREPNTGEKVLDRYSLACR